MMRITMEWKGTEGRGRKLSTNISISNDADGNGNEDGNWNEDGMERKYGTFNGDWGRCQCPFRVILTDRLICCVLLLFDVWLLSVNVTECECRCCDVNPRDPNPLSHHFVLYCVDQCVDCFVCFVL
jgi:hypothetical protein